MPQGTIQYTSPLQGNINFMYRKGVSCDYHRIILPAQQMGIDIDAPAKAGSMDVFCRIPPVDRVNENDKFIVDVDDYWHLYPHHYLFNTWNGNNTANKIIQAIKSADVVTTTNEVLGRHIRRANKNVEIIPNALPFDSEQFQYGNMNVKATFFWAGGASHMNDIAILRNVLTNTPYELILMGDDGGAQWAKIKSTFAGKAQIKKQMPIDSYMAGFQGNVMLIPLENNPFNQCKSNLKILEAGCKGMAVIASRMHPYYTEKDEPYVMYADSVAEWQAHIRYCIANPGFVHEMGSALSEHVRKEYHLDVVNIKRRQIYESIL